LGSKRNKIGRVATEAKDHSIHGDECKTTKRIRYLQLSPNVNDYDTGETEAGNEKDSMSFHITSKKTGNKFQEIDK
jgi:hypothetical protein